MKTRALFVYEYPVDRDEMARSLLAGLRRLRPDLELVTIAGAVKIYRPGGLGRGRLLNLAWVYLQVAWRIACTRIDVIVVRSTPPGIQLWAMAWARARGLPVIAWLMDNHPEMEARVLDRRGWPRVARALRALDAWLLPHFAQVVVLDAAMAAVVRSRAPQVEIVVHPTWSAAAATLPPGVPYAPGASPEELHLAYSGNLGAAHDLAGLRDVLVALRGRRTVRLWVIGASGPGSARLRGIGEELGIAVADHPRVPFAELRGLYARWRIDAGIVLLAEASAGLVSPSKFSGYIRFGLPVLYVGPADTNAAVVCERFGGGFWLRPGADAVAVDSLAAAMSSAPALAAAAAGARAAADYFQTFDGESLAALIAPRIPGFGPLGAAHRPAGLGATP